MNTNNNKRRRESQEKIEQVFIDLLQDHEIKDISVSLIIKIANVNRSTFYANYIDIYDLADKIKEKYVQKFLNVFGGFSSVIDHVGALRLFEHIKENPSFYTTYFKLCYDDKHLTTKYISTLAKDENLVGDARYHIEFFRSGINAVVKLWIANGCRETPEEMLEILKSEYRGRTRD